MIIDVHHLKRGRRDVGRGAFTLIEVMIALAIFFMAMFSILGVFSASLHSTLLLRKNGPTAGMVASELSLTNKLEEGDDQGNFGDVYPGYTWTSHTEEVATNGFFRVDFAVVTPSGNVDSTLSAFFYRPDSDNSTLGGRASFMNR